MLRRVVQNFISNALRYTRTGRVVIGCRRRADNEVELQVLDTGPGIPAERQHVVFEEFQRLDQQSPWGEKGLGLGLSICDRIAAILGAQLTISSTPARGSMFGIRVVRAREMPPAEAPSVTAFGARLASSTLRSVRVLCVEDDLNILDGLRELLTRWGMHVFAAEGAEAAYAAMREHRIDVVLADYHLQGRPLGLAVLERVTKRTGDARAPRGALITADRNAALLHQARTKGFQVLRKPVRPAALRALIGALVHSTSDGEPPTGAVQSKADEPAL
jgi:CheY-like chemotaxis protein/anti-sigma regulatory factor (Ser/Thr protein kinase)